MYPVKHAAISATADGENAVIAGVAGKVIVVLGYTVTATVASPSQSLKTVFRTSNASPVVLATFFASDLAFPASVGYVGNWEAPAFAIPIGEGLDINNDTGVDVVGHITYMLK